MKNDLPYFSHDNNARRHPKMKALVAEFGFEGYGRFWVLNEKIAETNGAKINISKKLNRLDLANELGLDGGGLDKFLKFLSDPEIDLINIKDGFLTTDRINELFEKTIYKRKKQRKNDNAEIADDFAKINADNAEIADDFAKINADNAEIVDDLHTEEKRREENRQEENIGSTEPPLSVSQKSSLELAALLLASHRKEYPDYLSGKDTKKITEKWAEDIEKLIRIDKKPPETIRQVILWVKTASNFWFHNIESGRKLREKFERLNGEMQTRKTSPPEKERNSFIPTAEQSEIYLREQEKQREQADYSGNLSEELKRVARGDI
jgi:hypothetical protein